MYSLVVRRSLAAGGSGGDEFIHLRGVPVKFRADDPCPPIQNDISTDSNMFTTELDQSTDAGVRNTIVEEIPPSKCRFVRLTMITWPRATPLRLSNSRCSTIQRTCSRQRNRSH